MKLIAIAMAATLVCATSIAQTPDAAQRAENRANARELADKATPGPARRAQNRAKAAELAHRATPDASQRAENRAKAGSVADKTVEGVKRAGRATRRGVMRAGEAGGNVARKAGSKVRHTGDAIARRLPPAERGTGSDTSGRTAAGAGRASSAAADDLGDGARRGRIDEAYSNWQRQQGSR